MYIEPCESCTVVRDSQGSESWYTAVLGCVSSYIRQGGYVFAFVCLSVCPQGNSKLGTNYDALLGEG